MFLEKVCKRCVFKKTPVSESLFNEAAVLKALTLLKRDYGTLFSCEICEISTYFKGTLMQT